MRYYSTNIGRSFTSSTSCFILGKVYCKAICTKLFLKLVSLSELTEDDVLVV